MRHVALHYGPGCPPRSAPLTPADQLSLACTFLRAIENGAFGAISSCLSQWADLRDYVDNPYLLGGNLTARLSRLRAFVVELARRISLEGMEAASTLQAQGHGEEAARRRSQEDQEPVGR